MTIIRILAALAISVLTCAAAQAEDITGDALANALRKNPDVLIEAVKANRKAIFDIINLTGVEEQARMRREDEEAAQKAYEDTFNNPLTPAIDDKTRIRGAVAAKYTLVEYADFQCPYCAAGYLTVEELRKKYGNNLRFIFKNLPLPFHPQAMPAAQWFEAIAIQSAEKAWKFHDLMFANQDKLGIDLFRKTAKDLGIDVKRCERDAASPAVKDRIAADMNEAQRYGFEGTPGFLVNGIPVKGAYPLAHFEDVIKKIDATKTN
jgi:protein-disulfide isomerase